MCAAHVATNECPDLRAVRDEVKFARFFDIEDSQMPMLPRRPFAAGIAGQISKIVSFIFDHLAKLHAEMASLILP